MPKFFITLLALVHISVFASLITPSNSELVNSNYILSLNEQYYGERYREIMRLVKSNELDKAKLSLAYLLTEAPNDKIALDISGNILLAENKILQALNAFQRSLSSGQSPEIMAKVGVCHLLMNEHQQAKMWLTQSLSLAPNNKLALRYLAWLEEQALNTGTQFHYLDRLVKQDQHGNSLYEYHINYLTLLVDNNNTKVGLEFIENNREKLRNSSPVIAENIKLIEIELLLKAGETSLASKKYEQFPEPSEQDGIATNYYLLSVYYYAAKQNYEKAESIVFTQFSENGDAKAVAEYSLAKVYFSQRNFQSAHEKLATLLANETKNHMKMSYIDDIVANYSAQSRYSDAIKFLKAQIKEHNNAPHFHHQLAELYIIAGRAKAARNQLDNVISQFPDYVPSYIVKARQLIKGEEDQTTTDFFEFALNKHPATAELWLDYGKFYFNNGHIDKALETLERAVKKNENNPLLTFELASLYDHQNLLAKSEPLYIKVLQAYPDYLPALDNLASNFFALGKNKEIAITLAKRAYSLSPNDIFINNLRAQAYIAEKQSASAIELMSPIIDSFNQSGLAHFTMATAHHELNNDQLADKFLEQALSKDLPHYVKLNALKLKREWNK